MDFWPLIVYFFVHLVNSQLNFLGDEVIPVIDTCFNTSVTSDLTSVVYKCNENGYVKYTFEGTDECESSENTTTTCSYFGGCDSILNGTYYDVQGCTEAQAAAAVGGCRYVLADDNSTYVPINHCINDASGSSSKFLCISDSDDVLKFNYGSPDCNDVESNSTYFPLFSTCSQSRDESCGLTVRQYHYKDLYCSPQNDGETNKYGAPSDKKCNYFAFSDYSGNFRDVIATDVCFKSRRGDYEWSNMYKCSDDGTQVSLWYYINNPSCQLDDSAFQVSVYTNANYTISCGESSCSKAIYTNYTASNTTSCRPANFDETPVAYSTCKPVYSDPDSSLKDYSYNNISRMTTCFGESNVNFFFIGSGCTGQKFFSSNWIYTEDWFTDNCYDYQMTGCSNSEYKENSGHVLGLSAVVLFAIALLSVD